MFKEYSKIMGYIILTILIFAIVGGGLKVAGVFGERVVFENSFQYKKGMESRASVLQSQIAQIDADIIKNPDKRDELLAQKRVLQIQLEATKI